MWSQYIIAFCQLVLPFRMLRREGRDAVEDEERLEIHRLLAPERAVVVPGSRPIGEKLPWGQKMNLQMNCAIIVKYRDEKSDASLTLESILR